MSISEDTVVHTYLEHLVPTEIERDITWHPFSDGPGGDNNLVVRVVLDGKARIDLAECYGDEIYLIGLGKNLEWNESSASFTDGCGCMVTHWTDSSSADF